MLECFNCCFCNKAIGDKAFGDANGMPVCTDCLDLQCKKCKKQIEEENYGRIDGKGYCYDCLNLLMKEDE